LCNNLSLHGSDTPPLSRASWMKQSHYREGDRALLAYNVVKGPELSNPLDPGSEPTGNTSFVLTEVYANPCRR